MRIFKRTKRGKNHLEFFFLILDNNRTHTNLREQQKKNVCIIKECLKRDSIVQSEHIWGMCVCVCAFITYDASARDVR